MSACLASCSRRMLSVRLSEKVAGHWLARAAACILSRRRICSQASLASGFDGSGQRNWTVRDRTIVSSCLASTATIDSIRQQFYDGEGSYVVTSRSICSSSRRHARRRLWPVGNFKVSPSSMHRSRPIALPRPLSNSRRAPWRYADAGPFIACLMARYSRALARLIGTHMICANVVKG
jgi:hypothetical protein